MEKSVYEAIQIDEKSWRIEENGVRSFLFVGTEKAMLVDTGFGTGNIREVVESLTKLPVMLVNTHADGDHLGCNKLFDKAYMHPAEFDRYHQKMGYEFTAEPLWEDDIIDLGGRCFEVILIPGHTPGSIVLLDAENKVLIGGDSIQAGNIYMFGAGRNIHAYIHSMKELAIRKHEPFDTVYPSHGPFPVDAGIIDALISGAEQVRDGKIEGVSPPRDVPAKLYDVGAAKFLY
jgi:glyoxylase-like metal-dependent hydrolase (beta-lactamase superfamily II)